VHIGSSVRMQTLMNIPSLVAYWRDKSLSIMSVSSDMKDRMKGLSDAQLDLLLQDFGEARKWSTSVPGAYVNGAYWEWCRRQEVLLLKFPLRGTDTAPRVRWVVPQIRSRRIVRLVFLVENNAIPWKGEAEVVFDFFVGREMSIWASDEESRAVILGMCPWLSIGLCQQFEPDPTSFVVKDGVLSVFRETGFNLTKAVSQRYFGVDDAVGDVGDLMENLSLESQKEVVTEMLQTFEGVVGSCSELLVLDCFSGLGPVASEFARREEVARVTALESNPLRNSFLRSNVKCCSSSEKMEVLDIGICSFLKLRVSSQSITYLNFPDKDFRFDRGRVFFWFSFGLHDLA